MNDGWIFCELGDLFWEIDCPVWAFDFPLQEKEM